jgi:hypothetical protein
MNRKNLFIGMLAIGFLAASVVAPSVGYAQADPRVTKSMETLKAMTAKLGAPKLEGNEAVGGKEAPVHAPTDACLTWRRSVGLKLKTKIPTIWRWRSISAA